MEKITTQEKAELAAKIQDILIKNTGIAAGIMGIALEVVGSEQIIRVDLSKTIYNYDDVVAKMPTQFYERDVQYNKVNSQPPQIDLLKPDTDAGN